MDKVIEAMRNEIQAKESELARLREAMRVLNGRQTNPVRATAEALRKKTYRRVKNTRWSDLEVRQLIDMYNKLPMNHYQKVSKIASVFKLPKYRIRNKLYTLSQEGKISLNTEVVVDGNGVKPRGKRGEYIKWTPEKVQELKDMKNRGFTVNKIARHFGTSRSAINNKYMRILEHGFYSRQNK